MQQIWILTQIGYHGNTFVVKKWHVSVSGQYLQNFLAKLLQIWHECWKGISPPIGIVNYLKIAKLVAMDTVYFAKKS